MAKPFRFKQFHVFDHHSTMKVGTDAVLLGTWGNPPMHGKILDIGTGCGILALMTAQRTHAIVTAIDIDKASIEQATQNFRDSPWSSRLRAIHTGLVGFSNDHPHGFDYIISNPPFFINCLKTNNPRKDVARHASDGLMKAFVGSLARILKPEGKIALVLPTERFDKFQNLLDQSELFILRFCKVLPRIGLAPTRLLLELVKLPVDMIQEEALVLRGRDNQYTDQYKELTREFYLFLNE